MARGEEWDLDDCLRAQMALMRATKKQVDTLLDTIKPRMKAFGDLLENLLSQLIPVHVISDGFDYSLIAFSLSSKRSTRCGQGCGCAPVILRRTGIVGVQSFFL